MIKIERTTHLPDTPLTDAFAFVADYANLPLWDPGAVSAEQTTPGAVGEGTEYRVVVRVLAFAAPMDYRVVAWHPPHRVELRGTSPAVQAHDVVTFESDGGHGTRIAYVAQFSFRAGFGLAERMGRRLFSGAADRAMAGLVAARIPRASLEGEP